MIKYVIGDAANPTDPGRRIIAHVCNDINRWGKGFVMMLSAKWPKAKESYHDWFKGGKPKLGDVQFVGVDANTVIANMIGQEGIHPKKVNGKEIPPIRYKALEQCLRFVSDSAKKLGIPSVHMPRIGCGLAGGEWSRVENIINSTLIKDGVSVYVYDLPRRKP